MNATLNSGVTDLAAILQITKNPYPLSAIGFDTDLGDQAGTLFLAADGDVEVVCIKEPATASVVLSLKAGFHPIYVKQIKSAGSTLTNAQIFICPPK